MSSPEDKIVLSYHDSLLRQSDIDLIRGPHWLNDQIISFFFEYLSFDMFKDVEEFLFVSPEVTQCMKMVGVEEIDIFLEPLQAKNRLLIFFALNNNERNVAGGSHWSLLVWCGPQNTFYHFDSASNANQAVSEVLHEKLKAGLDCPSAKLKESTCLRQSNSYDCGIHVIAQTEAIAKGAQRYLTGPDNILPPLDTISKLRRPMVDHKREHILSIVESLVNDEPLHPE